MANVEDTRYAYELLIRGNPDGTVAAHVQYLRVIKLDGAVIKQEVEPPVGVSPESVEGTPFQVIVGELAAVALRDNEAKAAVVASQAEVIESQSRQIEALTTERDQLLAKTAKLPEAA